MTRRLFAIHRWISAVALVQLAVWTVSGLFFAAVPISRVRGPSNGSVHRQPLPAGLEVVPPGEVLARSAGAFPGIESIELLSTPAGLFYLLRGKDKRLRLDALTGLPVPVTRGEAEATARRDQPGNPVVRSAELVTENPPVEIRGRSLPAWRVDVAGDTPTSVWIDGATGEVLARRSDLWRLYDFLWSLHIMDYRDRESFNHPLIIGAAALGLGTVLSGAGLWGLRIWRNGRRRSSAGRG